MLSSNTTIVKGGFRGIMRYFFMFLCLATISTGCSNTIPQRPIPFFNEQLDYNSEIKKNQRAREIIQYIRSTYGTASALSIKSIGPKGNDYSDVVREFGSRAAVSYTKNSPELIVYYDLKFMGGFYSGPNVKNFELSALLIKPSSLNDGTRVLMESSLIDICYTNKKSKSIKQCELVFRESAELLLYKLQKVERDD